MTTSQADRKPSAPARKEVSPKVAGAIIAAFVVLSVLTVLRLTGDRASGGAPLSAQETARLDADAKWWEASARQSGGDYNRLSESDQNRGIALAGSREKAANTLYGLHLNQARLAKVKPNAQVKARRSDAECNSLRATDFRAYKFAVGSGLCG